MRIPKFGINRQDAETPARFAEDVARIETLGWDCVWLPDSQLRRRDTYVLLAAAALATESIQLGTLIVNPITRHPSVTASSIATIDELAPGRVSLGFGAGDTAVRLSGLRPARVGEMEDAIVLMRKLLAGEAVEVGAERPANLPFHRPVPIWLTAGGPRTLEMGGRVATASSCALAHIRPRLPTPFRRFGVERSMRGVIRSRFLLASSSTLCLSTIRTTR